MEVIEIISTANTLFFSFASHIWQKCQNIWHLLLNFQNKTKHYWNSPESFVIRFLQWIKFWSRVFNWVTGNGIIAQNHCIHKAKWLTQRFVNISTTSIMREWFVSMPMTAQGIIIALLVDFFSFLSFFPEFFSIFRKIHSNSALPGRCSYQKLHVMLQRQAILTILFPATEIQPNRSISWRVSICLAVWHWTELYSLWWFANCFHKCHRTNRWLV